MGADVVPADGSHAEIMASIESSTRQRTFIIADITRDDAWLSMGAAEAPTLDDWR
jgi:hypothetical protein